MKHTPTPSVTSVVLVDHQGVRLSVTCWLPKGRSFMDEAEAGGNFIRDRLREVSFARRILPPPSPSNPLSKGMAALHQQGLISNATLIGKEMAHDFAEEMKKLKELTHEPAGDSSVEGGDRPSKL